MTKLNDPYFLFLAAKEYFENGSIYAAKYFRHKDFQIVKPFDNKVHTKLCVPVTNISFGVELALKSILMRSKKSMRIHNLMRLFTALDTETQTTILDYYKKNDNYANLVCIRLWNNGPDEHGSREIIRQNIKTDDYVLKMLEAHKLAFEKYRYLYEYDGKEMWWFDFRAFCNFGFAVLAISGEKLGIQVQIKNVKQIFDK